MFKLWLVAAFFLKVLRFRAKTELYSKIWINTKDFKNESKFSDNLLHNFLEFCKELAQVWFVTSKTGFDITHVNLCTRVTSRSNKRLKT